MSPFRIERYYARYEFPTRYMLSSSDCESRTIAELLELEPDATSGCSSTWCGYTESPGAPELREAIAALYERQPDDVVVASCAEEGIFLLYHALLGPGDHAIVETPCYESALELARSTGAEVSPWRRRYEDGWAHDLDALERLIRPDTRLIYLNQPHNPTGTLMARRCSSGSSSSPARRIVLFGDEVYRELEHDPAGRLPAACDATRAPSRSAASPRATACRACGSAGSPPATPSCVTRQTSSTTRRSAQRPERGAHRARAAQPPACWSSATSRSSGATCRCWMASSRATPTCSSGCARPRPDRLPARAGDGDVDRCCERLAEAGVLLLPGSVYDEPEHVRVGFGRADMPEALERLEAYLAGGG